MQTSEGHWVPIEPTPGYQILSARKPLLQALAATLSKALNPFRTHPLACIFAAIAVLTVVVFRRRLEAWAAMAWWRLRLNDAPRQQVLRSVMLLQRLTARSQSGRRTGQTLDQWIEKLGQSHDSGAIAEFRALVSWACYASTDRPIAVARPVREVCVDSVNLLKERV